MNALIALTERVALLCRMAVPFAFLAVLFILNVVSLNFTTTGSIKASFLLMGIYYWSVFRPTLIPSWFVFLCGILLDFLNGFPPGLNALMFVAVRWAVSDSRRFLMAQPFFMLWMAFGLVVAATHTIQWAVYSMMSEATVPFVPVMASMGLGVFLFPFVCVFLHMTHKALPAAPGKFVS